MKKLFLFLLTSAALSVGGFALDLPDAISIPGLSVSGDIHTGLRVLGEAYHKPDNVSDDGWKANLFGTKAPKVEMYSDDVDNGVGFRAQFTVTYAPGPIGIQTRLRYDPNKTYLAVKGDDLAAFLNRVVIWGDLFDSKARVTLGKNMSTTWASNWIFNDFSEGWDGFDSIDGVKLEVKEVLPGLNAGLSFGANDMVANLFKGTSGLTFTHIIDTFNFGATYDHAMFTATVAGRYYVYDGLESANYAGAPYSAIKRFDMTSHKNGNTMNLFVAGTFKGLENLPLKIDLFLGFTGLGAPDYDKGGSGREGHNYGWSFLPRLKAEYTLTLLDRKLAVGLKLDDMLIADVDYMMELDSDEYNDNLATTPDLARVAGGKFPISIKPYASYAITETLTCGLELGFKINKTDEAYISGTGASQMWMTSPFVFNLKPSAEFKLGDGAKFVVYDSLDFISGNKAEDSLKYKYANYGVSNGEKTFGGVKNTLQFDFVWSF